MKTKIKFKVLFYNGEVGVIYHQFSHVKFKEIVDIITIGGVERECITTFESQLDQVIEDWDKRDWMERNDIQAIYNWEIPTVKKKTATIKLTKLRVIETFLQEANFSDKMKLDFVAVYSKMRGEIKDLSPAKQISIIFSVLSVAYDASSAAYQHIVDYGKDLEEKAKSIRELPWEKKMGIGTEKFKELLKSDIQTIKNFDNDQRSVPEKA